LRLSIGGVCRRLVDAELQAVIGDPRLDAALAAETADERAEKPLVAANDLRTAMREDGARHSLRPAPVELRADRRMTDPHPVATADNGAGDRRAVTDVEIDRMQRRRGIADRDNKASVAQSSATADAKRTQ